MATSARRIAIEQLQRIEETDAFVGRVADAWREAEVSPRDDRQAVEYVAGVTRWKRYLDFVLSAFARNELNQLDPPLLQILRVAAYDLLILGTPPHAAVNEAVRLTKRLVRPEAGRLTNGLLRNLVRRHDALPQPETADHAERLGILYSHPDWIVRRWLDRYGEEDARRLLAWNNRRPRFGLRINTLRTTVEQVEAALRTAGAEAMRSQLIPYFVRVRQLQPVLELGLIDDGLCAVQDESAGLVVRALDPQPGERVLDLCAAPGGKALHAAQLMRDEGDLLAVDVHEGRLGLVRRAAAQQGATILKLHVADGRQLSREDVGTFDRVLLDAPCSGLGVLGRRADLRWHRSQEDLAELTALQDALLEAAADLVRPGGLLLYGTCTIEPEENDERIARFLERHSEFELEALSDLPATVLDASGYLRTLPHRHEVDGVFAARMRRSR